MIKTAAERWRKVSAKQLLPVTQELQILLMADAAIADRDESPRGQHGRKRWWTQDKTLHNSDILAAGAGPKIFCRSHSWREILNNKYPANNECAAGCSCLEGIISNFLPMFHIPTPACRRSPSLHPNAGSYHFYLFFKSIYESKPRQTSAGQMQNAKGAAGAETPVGAAWDQPPLNATLKHK